MSMDNWVLDTTQCRNPVRLTLQQFCAGKGSPYLTYLCRESQHSQVTETRVIGWRQEMHTFRYIELSWVLNREHSRAW